MRYKRAESALKLYHACMTIGRQRAGTSRGKGARAMQTSVAKPPCDEAEIRSKSAAAPCAPSAGVWVLVATILGSSISFIDGTVVNVALPTIQRELHANAADVQWV